MNESSGHHPSALADWNVRLGVALGSVVVLIALATFAAVIAP